MTLRIFGAARALPLAPLRTLVPALLLSAPWLLSAPAQAQRKAPTANQTRQATQPKPASSANSTGPAQPGTPPTLPDARALIDEGVGLHDKEQYDEAIARYTRVTPGDSLYMLAQEELALSLLAAEKYADCVAAAQRSLALEPFSVGARVSLAAAQEGLKQLDAARQTYADGLRLFPYSEQLWLNWGITEFTAHQTGPALAYLERAAELRPAHGSPHRLLGILAVRQGQPSHALLSLVTFLAIEPLSARSQPALVLVEALAGGTATVDAEDRAASVAPNAAFEELDQLITSKIALNKNYLTKVRFDAALVKQVQLLVEKFPLDADPATDFWLRAYAPLIRVLRQEDNLTTFTYVILQSANDDKARAWVKANKSRAERLIEALSPAVLSLRDQQPLPDGKPAAAWFNGLELQGLGAGTRGADGTVTPSGGPWLLIGAAGQVRSRGSFAGPAKRGGLWQDLRPDGSVEREETYAATGPDLGELDGPSRYFYPDGQLLSEATHRAGKLEGPSKSYTAAGKLDQTRTFVNNDYEGELTDHYPDGSVRYRARMKADQRDGPTENFYPDGTPEARMGYVAGQRQGPFEVFYPNKTLERKGSHDQNELHGDYLENFVNGQTQEAGTYAHGKRTGAWREYFANGQLSVEKTYDAAGELHGRYRDYDARGRYYADTYYEHGRMSRLVYVDAAGKPLADVPLKKSRQEVKTYDSEGRVRGSGAVENGYLTGEWRRFFADGSLRTVEHFDGQGTRVGVEEQYYATGPLRQRRAFGPDGKAEGYFEQFYVGGQLQQTGFYRAGEPQGEWRSYNANGKLSQTREYHQGDVNGPMRDYEAGGQLVGERTFAFGKLRRLVAYDSTGRETERLPLTARTAELTQHLPGAGPTGPVLSRASLHDGTFEGPMTWYFPDGKPEVSQTMRRDKRYGAYRTQFATGQTRTEGTYLNGERYGPYAAYYPNGQPRIRGRYLADEQAGEWTYYFPNGQVEKTVRYTDEGVLDGPSRYFNPAGELLLERRYVVGELLGCLSPLASTTSAASTASALTASLQPAVGAVQTTFANGQPAASETYAHANLSGPAVYYYAAGPVFRRVAYAHGLRTGPLTSYWPNGKLMEEENYLAGELHGRCRYYRPDGTLERTETYCVGEQRGPAVRYDAQGRAVGTDFYWNNSFYK